MTPQGNRTQYGKDQTIDHRRNHQDRPEQGTHARSASDLTSLRGRPSVHVTQQEAIGANMPRNDRTEAHRALIHIMNSPLAPEKVQAAAVKAVGDLELHLMKLKLARF